MGFKQDRKTRRRARERKKQQYGKSSPMCRAYGHQWEIQPGASAALRGARVIEQCKWCDKERVTMRPGGSFL